MKHQNELSKEAYIFDGKLSFKQAIPLGLQHVLAMFVGNLTPLLIITGACGMGSGSEFADLQVALLQNAMLVAGIVTLVQLFSIGPVGGKSLARSNVSMPCCRMVPPRPVISTRPARSSGAR